MQAVRARSPLRNLALGLGAGVCALVTSEIGSSSLLWLLELFGGPDYPTVVIWVFLSEFLAAAVGFAFAYVAVRRAAGEGWLPISLLVAFMLLAEDWLYALVLRDVAIAGAFSITSLVLPVLGALLGGRRAAVVAAARREPSPAD